MPEQQPITPSTSNTNRCASRSHRQYLHALAAPFLFGAIVWGTSFGLWISWSDSIHISSAVVWYVIEVIGLLITINLMLVAIWFTMRPDERHDKWTHGRNSFPDFRLQAAMLVLGSGAVLLMLGWFLQAAAWEAMAYARRMDAELPRFTWWALHMFGLRPHGYALDVTIWFWWPMVAMLVHCHLRYPQRRVFAAKFAYGFALCWLLFLIALFFAIASVSLMYYILLADIEQPPAFMSFVPPLSATYPFLTIAIVFLMAWRIHRKTVKKYHNS